jgi:hypothetical protein
VELVNNRYVERFTDNVRCQQLFQFSQNLFPGFVLTYPLEVKQAKLFVVSFAPVGPAVVSISSLYVFAYQMLVKM